jgi:hypothetical protein
MKYSERIPVFPLIHCIFSIGKCHDRAGTVVVDVSPHNNSSSESLGSSCMTAPTAPHMALDRTNSNIYTLHLVDSKLNQQKTLHSNCFISALAKSWQPLFDWKKCWNTRPRPWHLIHSLSARTPSISPGPRSRPPDNNHNAATRNNKYQFHNGNPKCRTRTRRGVREGRGRGEGRMHERWDDKGRMRSAKRGGGAGRVIKTAIITVSSSQRAIQLCTLLCSGKKQCS